ncbi:MAG: hypothetical protein KDC66_07910 [Phaeodactylibacter sp.]|nr:hypothetical protein [Phaeodactylibacter sp.]MCB9275605.1 exopolyphosphatase [Lewinellaceae bacterium]
MKLHAVIDLGTNTFHLLIAEERPGFAIHEVYRERQFVKLAEEGIETIGAMPYRRGLDTLHHYRRVLDEYGIPAAQVRALGTAALRTAGNGQDFLRDVQEQTGIAVQLISGDREAELIYKGVILAVPPTEEHMLIMDIGGGSVEFIIADQSGIYWAQSFPIGVAVLYRRFHRHEPILPEETQQLEAFLSDTLAPLWEKLKTYPCRRLAGASGTFDVVADFIGVEGDSALHYVAPATAFFPFQESIVRLTQEERHSLPKLPPERADLIVVALILLKAVIRQAGIEEVVASAYAMKEGMLYEMLFT